MDGSYHFFGKKNHRRIEPFVVGDYSLYYGAAPQPRVDSISVEASIGVSPDTLDCVWNFGNRTTFTIFTVISPVSLLFAWG